MVIDTLNPTLAQIGTQIMTKFIRAVWTFILDMWKSLEQHLHDVASQLNIPDYQQAATMLYELRQQLPPTTQEALFQHPLEQILALPAP